MRRRNLCALALMIFLTAGFISGCTPNAGEEYWEEPADIIFRSQTNGLFSMTIGENAEVYAAAPEGKLSRYTFDGELLEEYPMTEGMLGLHYANGLVYGFIHGMGSVCDIVEFDPESGSLRTVYAGLPVFAVKSLSVSGPHVFLVVSPPLDAAELVYEGDYLDMSEQFLSINIQSGELTEITSVSQPIVHYQSSDGALYIYARDNGRYMLYSYNIQRDKASEAAEMADIGYLFAFAYERDCFIFATSEVRVKNMSSGLIYTAAYTFPSIFGGCFSYYEGNLVYLDQQENKDMRDYGDDYDDHDLPVRTSIRTLRLNPDYVLLMNGEQAEHRGSIVISASTYNRLFSIDALYARSGIAGAYVDQPVMWDEYQKFLTSILAKDDSIDIYILHLHNDVSRSIRKKGAYASLSDSRPIQAYLEQCFDWVGDSARTSDGDIWMLPLYFDAPMLWYVPENFERFGLSPADVADLDRYLETVERLNREKGGYTTHAPYFANYEPHWFWQYEMAYCDYENGSISFQTELFSRFFQSMWSGFLRYESSESEISRHPILQQDREFPSYNHDKEETYYPSCDVERVIFTLEYISSHLETIRSSIADWRALPVPRLTEEVKYNYFTSVYAFVNPYGKNKDLAVAYLEAAAADMLSAINRPVFAYKDLSAYNGYYDMSIPLYQDLYHIYRDGAAVSNVFPDGSTNVVDDYQHGIISLDEAVNEIQREAKIWLFE